MASGVQGNASIGGNVILSGDKLVFQSEGGSVGFQTRTIDLKTKTVSTIRSQGERVENEYPASNLVPDTRLDYYSGQVYQNLWQTAFTIPELKIIFSVSSSRLEGQVVSSTGVLTSNGLQAIAYRPVTSSSSYTNYGVATVLNKKLTSVLQTGEVIGGRAISSIGDWVAPHSCSVSVFDADAASGIYQRVVTVFPVIITSLSAGPDGRTARMGGCGLNLEGTTLDNISIGGATAEVISRETDPTTGQDVLILRPLSPVYAGPVEAAVTINGRRFASTLIASGPSAPSITVVNAASFEQKLSPQTIAVLRSTGSTGNPATAGPNAAFLLGGANIRVCDFPARLLYNSGSSLNFLIPTDVAGKESCEIVLSVNSRESGRATVKLDKISPAIFGFYPNKLENGEIDMSLSLPIVTFVDESGAQHYIGPENTNLETVSATPSQVVSIWLTGAGATFPEVPDANNTPPDGFYRCVDDNGKTENPDGSPVSPIVKIGGVAAEVSFCGLVPNSTGLYLINARVPMGTVPGDNYLWIGEDKDGNPLSPIYRLWTK